MSAHVMRCGVHFFWKAGDGVAPSIAAPLRLRVPLLVLPARPLEVFEPDGVKSGGGMPFAD